MNNNNNIYIYISISIIYIYLLPFLLVRADLYFHLLQYYYNTKSYKVSKFFLDIAQMKLLFIAQISIMIIPQIFLKFMV